MNNLLELNRTTLHSKLSKVQKRGDLYVANDIINLLSNQKERDKRLINDYNDDEIKTFTIRRSTGLKTMRFFTLLGITRYLHEGKLFDYNNACSYFSVTPKDKTLELYTIELEAMLTDTKKYNTKKLLKWLFGKRKMCKSLGDQTDIASVIELFGDSEEVIPEKLAFLRTINLQNS